MKPHVALVAALVISPPIARASAAQSPAPLSSEAAALVTGQRVEIKGRLGPDGSIEASRIRLQDKDSGVKIEGPVIAIDAGQRHLIVGGLPIDLADDVRVERADGSATLDDVRVGDVVEAKGRWSGQRLNASRLRIRPEPALSAAAMAAHEAEIEADIEQADGGARIVVLGRRVRLAPGGKIADERTPAATEASAMNSRLRRDEDDLSVAPLQIGEWITLGGRLGGDMRGHRRRDDPADEPERQEMATAAGQLLASAVLPHHIELYTKVGAERFFTLINEGGPLGSGASLRVYEAYATVGSDTPLGLQVGRQRFRDAREWFYDDYLDAVRLHVRGRTWRAEAAIAEGVFAGPAETRSRSDQRQAIASFTRRVGERTEGTAFLIARNDRSRRERPTWIGGEWNGRATSAIKYWGVGAMRRGESDTQRLRGWALDSGLAWRLPLTHTPSLTFRYAVASGDASGSDGADSRFRQTGLEDNSARFHGLKRFAQYGEVLDPELSNIAVLTFGAGVKPFSRTSIDVVYHRFTQRVRRRSLPSNRLDATGTGDSADLGDEFDLIVAIQQIRRIDFSIVAGIYRPGTGVASPASSVLYWKPEVRLFF